MIDTFSSSVNDSRFQVSALRLHPLRILQVIDSLNVGGAETLVVNLCAAWRKSGVHVELYALRGGPLYAEATRAGIVVHVAGAASVYWPTHILRLARFMQSRQFDIVHVHLYPAQLWACLASRLIGNKTPIVTTEHSTRNRRRTAFFRSLDRWMYRQFAATASISNAVMASLARHVGESATGRVIPNGIDETQFRLYHVNSRPIVAKILMVGNLTEVKNHATAIRAMTQIADAELLIAGAGPMRDALQALTCQLRLQDRVRFLGVRRDIAQLIAESDIYVQTSLWEGFCLAVVEAMCGGLPCIVSRVAGLQEVVGDAGVYFEPGSADELAARIRQLLQDADLRVNLAQRGREQARRFTLHQCLTRYELLYRTVAGSVPTSSNERTYAP